MANGITVKVEGLADIKAAMAELGPKNAEAIARAMTNAGAQLVKKAAVTAAPEADVPLVVDGVEVQPGNLKKNIVVKSVSKSRTRLTSEKIVTVKGKKKDCFAARYGRLVEYGTVKQPAQPFLRPALAKNIQPAIEAMKAAGAKRIKSIAARLVKKGK